MNAQPPSHPEVVPFAEDEVPAVDGRVPGRRGRQTRDRLLGATAQLLATRSYRDVKVVDIARQVGTSPATFYQYFPGVEAAVQLLARRVVEDGAELVRPLSGRSWRGREAWEASLGLVDVFLDFWRENAAVLRVIDLAIVEGDRRFRDIRDALLGPVTEELAEAIGDRRGADEDEARAEATTLVSMLAHVAEHQADDMIWGARLDAVRTRMAEHVHWGVTDRRRRTYS
jgi:AcrR family transcriptional regulator